MLKQPGWLRALEIIVGLMAIISSVIILFDPTLGIATLVFILSVGLIFLGIRSLFLAGHKGLSKGLRAMSAVSGILSLILAFLVIILPDYGVSTLLIFVSFGLLIYGIDLLSLAYGLKKALRWVKWFMATVGIIDVILSLVVLLLPGLALLTLAIVLAVVLLISGVEAIISGAVGRTWLGDLVETVKKNIQ
ncbi:MAG TPA: DUF308 domain-containing protein [Candidatus Thermoplasmatota archaeon]|nr:DUF308 domain-containing protein [Candidatus Thermoplasmatota archaeon]